jgi:hypothetical protein
MALNFGVLDQGGPSNFFEGYSQGQEKMQANAMAQQKAAQAQQEFGMRQQEFAAGQADKQRAAKAAAVTQKLGSYKDALLRSRNAVDARRIVEMQYADPDIGPIRSRLSPLEQALAEVPNEPTAFQKYLEDEAMGMEEVRKMQGRDRAFATAMGGAPQAMPQAAPTNAMAPVGSAAPVAPANAMVAPAMSGELQSKLTQRERLSALSNQDPRVKATIDRLDKDIARLSPAAQGPSPLARLQSELAALPPGDSRRADYLAAIKKETQFAPPASTTVVLPAQEKAFESGLGAGQSKKILDSKIAAEGALQILQTNDVGRSLLQSGAITGAGANFFVGLNKALKQGGIDFGYADAAANSQAYGSAMAANVGQLIKQFGAGTAISDADRAYATKAAAGEISMDEAAIRKVLDINDRASRNVIERHNKSVRGIKTNIPLEVEIPNAVAPPPAAASQIPTNVAPAKPAAATLAPVDKQALDWANANPKDPRSLQIKQRLGQ